MACPAESELLGFLSRNITAERTRQIETHFDDCGDCRALAFVLATQGGQNGDARAPLDAGAQIGRFVVDEAIAEGAMGMVFRAHDTTLRRDVALKLLRGGSRSPDAQARMVREAQGLARLDHPNVVTVYETGLHDDEVFIAMELVDGVSLERWLTERPRSWREVAAVLEQAARGLVAAHAAGLVHRDVKPANIMIASDGRVKVVDFGLARAVADVHPRARASSNDDVTTRLTATGSMVGTPAYCAPEQLAGHEVDTASDVFAFCVTFCEAVYGTRPFVAATTSELLSRMASGPDLPRAPRLPARLFALLGRGLAFDPAQRPSMEDIVALLAARPMRRRTIVIATLAAIAIAVTGSMFALAATSSESDACTSSAAELASAWNAQRRESVRAAILGTRLPFAASTWASVERALDTYRDRWIATHTETCRATAMDHTQSPELLDRRMACLAIRRASFDATVVALTETDRESVRDSMRLASSLPSLDECNDRTSLLAVTPAPTDPIETAQLAQVRQLLARAAALRATGKFTASRDVARMTVPIAERVGYKPAHAEALFELGLTETFLEHRPEAREALESATYLAASSGYATLEARIHAELSLLLRDDSPDGRVASGHVRQAIALLERTADDPLLAARVHYAAVRAYLTTDFKLSMHHLALGRKQLAAAAIISPDAVRDLEIEYTIIEASQLDPNRAIARLEPLLVSVEKAFGPDHPNLAAVLWQLAEFEALAERFDRAKAYAARVAEVLASYPDHDVALRRFLASLEPDPSKRLPLLEAVVRDLETHFGPTSPQLAITLNELAETLDELGRSREALPIIDRALAIMEAAYGTRYMPLLQALVTKTAIAYSLGDTKTAIEAAERTVALAEPDHYAPPMAVMAKVVLGELYFRMGRYADVLEIVKYIRANLHLLPPTTETDELELAFVEAACLWKLGRDATGLDRAREIHRKYRTAEGHVDSSLKDQADWLATHGR